MSFYQKHIFVCTNQKDEGKKCCAMGNADEMASYVKSALMEKGVHGPNKIRLSRSGCLGRCAIGPCLVVYPEGIWYTYRDKSDLDEIIDKQILKNEVVSRLLLSSD